MTVNWSAAVVGDVPWAFVTVIWYIPAVIPDGTSAVISVLVLFVMGIETEPILTDVAPERLVPDIVTLVVPVFTPLLGDMPDTAGVRPLITVNLSSDVIAEVP